MLSMFYEQVRPFFFQAPGNKLDLLSTSIMRGRQMQMIKKKSQMDNSNAEKVLCEKKKNVQFEPTMLYFPLTVFLVKEV